jgi:hypothetical protein
LLLLKEAEKRVGIAKALSDCILDGRHPGYISHTHYDMTFQRVMQIAAGYEDANDCNILRNDTVLKMCIDRAPVSGAPLASQPTMSRFENTPTNRELYRMAEAFLDNFMASYQAEPAVIILDADDTNADVHGGQQLSLFNDYYGEHCFMPLHIYEGFSRKLVTTILKPGRRNKSADVFAIIHRIIVRLRKRWKKTVIIVRGDGHFCSKELMDWSVGQPNTGFLTGLTGNAVLNREVAGMIKSMEDRFAHDKTPAKRYHSFSYKAESWKIQQRVIAKVEVSEKGTNVRFVVTNLEYRTRALYEEVYCARGTMELCIKDHKTYLRSDRMSCSDFRANQFRLFLHSAAYVLMHSLQHCMQETSNIPSLVMKTFRERYLKIATVVRELKTKVVVEFPRACVEYIDIGKYLASLGY